MGKQLDAGDPLVCGIAVGKVPPDISECRRTEKCVHDRVQKHVRIGMTEQTHRMRDPDTAEDQIAPFPVWVERYGEKIGNFGGIDTDAVCRLSKPELKEYITEVIAKCKGHGGFAFGSGNSIPSYVPVDQFLAMNEIIRELRGE